MQGAEQPTTIFEESRRIELKSQTCERVIMAFEIIQYIKREKRVDKA